jgi:DNA mismatch repair protein MutS
VTSAVARETTTPLMQQYREIKAQHKHAILFFRMGEFYEMFYEDAQLASRLLGLTLTSRNNGGAADVPLAGVPVRAAADYIRRLVQHGHRVAICEQVEDPALAKGVVKRRVIETVTPGAAFSDDLLEGGCNNFLSAIAIKGEQIGVAAADLSTGELLLAVSSADDLGALLARLGSKEVLLPKGKSIALPHPNALITQRDEWEFDAALGHDELTRHFGVHSLEGFGIRSEDAPALAAMGALIRYLREVQPGGVPHLAVPRVERPGGIMPLDEMTRRNLELVESLRAGADEEGTLLAVLDRTLTPMGARLLRQRVLAPLTSRIEIGSRLDGVDALVRDAVTRDSLRDALDGVRDIERLAGKTAAGRATPRELRALGDSISRLPAVEDALGKLKGGVLDRLTERWDRCAELAGVIASTLVERPPTALGDEATIATGVDQDLDELRTLRDGGKDAIVRIQAEERQRTGISSLKVGYNKVFGYFIEVSNSNSHLVPADYQRRQTLAGAERYVTTALKEYEERVLTAAERIEARERKLFEELRARIGRQIHRLQCVAQIVAELDVLASLADVADREQYVRPEVHEGFELEIVAGRHPVVERMMAREKFIPNDVRLTEDARMIILTGPNMAGKSTVLRQIGLIVLMTQMGSFVPARRASIGIADRVFTRVGASDNLVRGQSTFMVEMAETSAILHTATDRSLVLLDEIGRGTSTYDGVSIAWAVSEHFHDVIGCKTVFATHYHELTQLADELVAVRNYNVRVKDVGGEILFLHRLEQGGADRSYGIEVGKLAGLPEPVLRRAREVLRLLEGEQIVAGLGGPRTRPGARETDPQLALFGSEPHPVVTELRELDPNAITPMDALQRLARLVDEARRG